MTLKFWAKLEPDTNIQCNMFLPKKTKLRPQNQNGIELSFFLATNNLRHECFAMMINHKVRRWGIHSQTCQPEMGQSSEIREWGIF